MVQTELLNVNGKKAHGVLIEAPGGEGHANMLVIKCDKGYIMCGYLNMDIAEKFNDAAVVVGGASFAEQLANPVKAVSKSAEALGIQVGMTGAEAVEKLSI